jgi:predicted  nucleic acid-binding Zn-ribbon protein
MSGDAFRDPVAAALERASILEQEKADLEAEVAKLRGELGELGEHRDQLREDVRVLKETAAKARPVKASRTSILGALFGRRS